MFVFGPKTILSSYGNLTGSRYLKGWLNLSPVSPVDSRGALVQILRYIPSRGKDGVTKFLDENPMIVFFGREAPWIWPVKFSDFFEGGDLNETSRIKMQLECSGEKYFRGISTKTIQKKPCFYETKAWVSTNCYLL